MCTNASIKAVRAVLMHAGENDSFNSQTKKMSETEHKYASIIEREMPAFLYVYTNNNRFFLHKKFQLFTDHKTLLGSRKGGSKTKGTRWKTSGLQGSCWTLLSSTLKLTMFLAGRTVFHTNAQAHQPLKTELSWIVAVGSIYLKNMIMWKAMSHGWHQFCAFQMFLN